MDHSKIDSRNVVSMLLMAERMKVEKVINECVQYCYSNMDEVLSSRFNVGAISDKVLYKLASKFGHEELEALKDKKDKIKSKLYSRLLERMFVNDVEKDGASSLFRCLHCGLFLTEKSSNVIRCLPSRMGINLYGELIPLHQQDDAWNVHQYLKELYSELKSWRSMYWQIWGKVHYLRCSYCNVYFRLCDVGTCRYHLDLPKLDKIDSREAIHGCCGSRVTFFDPLDMKNGCQLQDHHVSDSDESRDLYDQLIKYRSLICVPSEKNILTKRISKFARQNSCITSGLHRSLSCQQTEAALTPSNNSSDDDESANSEENDEQVPYVVDGVSNLQSLRLNQILNWKWNPHRSVRYNQDAQREYEQVRISSIVHQFREKRGQNEAISEMNKNVSPGGIYIQLEADWRAKLPPNKLSPRKNSLVLTARSRTLCSSFDRKLYL